MVCQCFGVGEGAIRAALAQCTGSRNDRVAAVQAHLQCGTNCGSCLPELRALADSVGPASLPMALSK